MHSFYPPQLRYRETSVYLLSPSFPQLYSTYRGPSLKDDNRKEKDPFCRVQLVDSASDGIETSGSQHVGTAIPTNFVLPDENSIRLLAPFADMLNHSSEVKQCHVYDASSGNLSVLAGKDYKAGDQVYSFCSLTILDL